MRITFLLEVADELWGGIKVALEDANWLSQRGHQVTVVSRSGPPTWMQLDCDFQQVEDFRPEHLPDGDVLIGTFWCTVPWIASAGPQKGVPVHFCQGYEGDNPENAAVRERIEATYRLPGLHHVTISPHVTNLLRDRFSIRAHEVRYVVDHNVHQPGPERAPQSPLRVGLVGPYPVPWKDLPTGYEACRLAHKAGQNLILVRASNMPPSPEEQNLPFPIEWHEQLRPDAMGDFYRSLDVFVGTSSGSEEGFFLPAIEAMACGVPSVLTDIPCFRNHEKLVGHDRYALFVEAKDPAAMAEGIVLAGALPDVRSTLRSSGIEVAGHYHPEYHGEQLEAVLMQLTGNQTLQRPNELKLVTKEIPTPMQIGNGDRPTSVAGAKSGPTGHGEPPANIAPLPEPWATAQSAPDVQPLPKAPHSADTVDAIAKWFTELQQAAEQQHAAGQHDNAARLHAAANCLRSQSEHVPTLSAGTDSNPGGSELQLRKLDEQLRAGNDDETLHVARGHALHALGRMHEAAQAFRAALAVGARTADNYNRLGVVLFQAGDAIAARQSFERALVLDPQHIDARANLSSLPAA